MKVAVMQPYFLPYIGYWQLVNAVHKFIVYDNIQFTKSSWIRRNRILVNGQAKMIALPVKKDSDYLDVRERYLAETFPKIKKKILNQIRMSYQKAPEFNHVIPVITECLNYENKNLFDFIYHSIIKVLSYLGIDTEIIISSSLDIDHTLRKQYRIIKICKTLEGTMYINPIGGLDLYDKEEFQKKGIELRFIKTEFFNYNQFDYSFIPNLSIIDVMMFNSKDRLKKILECYTLL